MTGSRARGWYATLLAPALVIAALVTGLSPVGTAASADVRAESGISFIGPVTPLDTRRSTEIFPGGLFLDTATDASAAAARRAAAGDATSAALLRRIGDQPTAIWLGDWYSNAQLRTALARYVSAARQQQKTPVFVTYAIPNRDCGGYSAGGLSPEAYLEWNRTIASSLAGTAAVVIVEPDALASLTNGRCPGEQQRRLSTISSAVDILAGAGLSLYLDAGHSGWVGVDQMRSLLQAANIDKARGFVTNVSNYRLTADERAFDEKLSYALGGKHYVIDVSRNGAGWRGDWCNPAGAAIGQNPSVSTGSERLDALLWVKHPGQSDGSCNGGPAAGQWWESYALDLVRNQR